MDLWQFIKAEETIGMGGGSGIHVAFGADRNFVRPMGVAVTSVLAHNRDADIYIFTDELDSEDRKRLLRTADRYGGAIHIFYVDSTAFEDFPSTEYWSIATYFRFLLGVLYGRVKRLMYIDADAVAMDSLQELSKWDLGDKALGAVTELGFYDASEAFLAERWRRIGAVGESYFNAGMLLIDMDKWHEMHISECAFELIKSDPDRWRIAQDQDILNSLYMGKVCWLPGRYNLHCQDGGNQIIPEGTVIVHYAATPKPWSKCCQNLDSPWRVMAADSEWCDVPFDQSAHDARPPLHEPRLLP